MSADSDREERSEFFIWYQKRIFVSNINVRDIIEIIIRRDSIGKRAPTRNYIKNNCY